MSSGVVVLHFWSPSCAPCMTIKPSIEVMKEEFDQVEWVSVNTQADTKGFVAKFNVRAWPTMVILKNGQEIGRHTGTTMGVYYTLIRKALAA